MNLQRKIKLGTTLVLASALFLSCSADQDDAPEEELVKSVNVETEILQPRSFERYLRLVGTVEAQNDVRISAEVAGRITEYYVEKGDNVNRDEPIAKIDDSQLIREKERLEALTAQAKENYERLKRLYEEENVGSEIEYLNAKYNYEQNKAALESVKVSLNKTTVRAPFSGTIEDRLVDAGEMVNPGVSMVRLLGSNRLKVSAGVPARFAEVVNRGDLAEIWFDFAPEDTLRLPITFVGNSIDPQARTFEVEIMLPAKSRKYKVDMIANVKIRTFKQEEVLVVGEEYIYQKEEGYVVYTIAKNEQGNTVAREVPVALGPSYENSVIVERGLNPGDELITVGSSFVQDNMRVTIVNKDAEALVQGN